MKQFKTNNGITITQWNKGHEFWHFQQINYNVAFDEIIVDIDVDGMLLEFEPNGEYKKILQFPF